MYQKLPHLKLPIGYGPNSSHISFLADTVARLNFVNIEYHQSVAEHHPNLVLKFSYLKDLDEVESFNIIRVDRGK